MKKLDFYLDINHHDEIDDITNVVMNMGKPVFSFSNTNHCKERCKDIFSYRTRKNGSGNKKAYRLRGELHGEESYCFRCR